MFRRDFLTLISIIHNNNCTEIFVFKFIKMRYRDCLSFLTFHHQNDDQKFLLKL